MPLRLRTVPKRFYELKHLRDKALAQKTFTLATLTMTLTTIGQFLQSLAEESRMEVQCSYQDRRALRGSHRGQRSESSCARRFDSWKQQQRTSTQDFRQWKSKYKDSTLRTHVIRIRNPWFVQHRQRNIDSIPNPRNFVKALVNSDNQIRLLLYPYPQDLILILPLGMLKASVKFPSMIKS